ncbi:phage tail family protein [Paenibacillus silvisoli]|uniref:phage tail family protein n=1 Tax=Paenibacillus silvisoli TaxID=3110539 RepID=UPI002804C16D|nr:phage tail family protein [Paenibacillus silvisoli]
MSTDNGGATYDGVGFASVGLKLLKTNIPLLPDTRQVEVELPGVDGVLDMGMEYGPRLIELDVMMQASSESHYEERLQMLAKLFNAKSGAKALILDRAPGKRWMCKFNGSIGIEKLMQLGTFTLPLKAFYPFAESVGDTLTPLRYGQGYHYGMGLRIGDMYSFPVASSPKSLAVRHAGTHEAYPLIRLTGSGSNITITNQTTGESCTLALSMAGGDVVEIDCSPMAQTVKKNGANAIGAQSGKFPRLVDGDNNITITAIGVNLTVAFIFRHTYLY